MPGLGRKREMIREGQDWTQESSGYKDGGKVTGYKDGGKVGKVMGTSNKRKGRTKKIKTILQDPLTRYKKKARRP